MRLLWFSLWTVISRNICCSFFHIATIRMTRLSITESSNNVEVKTTQLKSGSWRRCWLTISGRSRFCDRNSQSWKTCRTLFVVQLLGKLHLTPTLAIFGERWRRWRISAAHSNFLAGIGEISFGRAVGRSISGNRWAPDIINQIQDQHKNSVRKCVLVRGEGFSTVLDKSMMLRVEKFTIFENLSATAGTSISFSEQL